jgi:hypothetical protein
MKEKLLAIIGAITLLISSASYAMNNINPENSIVKGYANNGRVLKVEDFYKNNLLYYVDPQLNNLTIEIDPT